MSRTVVKVTFQFWISDLYPEDEDDDVCMKISE